MKSGKSVLILLIAIVAVCAETYAQPAPADKVHAAANDYSAEPIVIEQFDHVYTMATDGTGVRQFTVASRIHSDAVVRQLGVLSLSYASSSEHIELSYVRVRRSDGSVTETPVTEAIEMPSAVTTAAPFYSDLKELQIPVRNLRVGDRLEWQAKFVRTKPDAPGQFWGEDSFITDGIVLSQSIELHVPKDIYVNIWSPTSKPIESTTSTEHIYRWESSQLKPTVGPEAEAEKDRKKKQPWTAEQELEEKEGKLPTVAWTTFKSWEAVGDWYRALLSDRILPIDPEVQAKVAEITAGKSTQQGKVRAVYAYISTQIRYIGVAFGIGRYQPHHAVEVLQNQYGDCKDKHTLLAAMLNVLGLHPDAVLIGAGVRFNEAVPSPQSFNHLITRVSVEGQTTWFDSTTEVAPYRVLIYPIRDKSALVIPDTGIATIERTPANLPFPAIQTMNAVGTLDDTGISNSRIVITFRDDLELMARAAFHQVSPSQYDELVQRFSLGIGYGGTTSHAEVSRPEDTIDPFKISYDYKRERAGDWENRRIVPQVAPVNLPRPNESDPPVRAIFLGTLRTEVSTSAMKIPDGWFAATPDDVHVKSQWATYDETYRFEKGTVYAERKIAVLQEKVPVADWKAYKKFADDADLGNEKFIELRTSAPTYTPIAPGGESSPTVTVSKPASDPQAAQLIAAGRFSIQRHEFEAAQSQLDAACSLNPKQKYLWANYGYLEFQRGNMSAAIPDYRKELELYPGNYGTYTSLAEAQNILGQEKEAEETLRKWAVAQPDSTAPVIALVSLLLNENHATEAVAAAEAGIARLPEMRKGDQGLQLLTGKAQLAAGMKQKGEATLLALLHTTTDPGMMNDAAYELSNAGLDLPLDESTAKEALDKYTAESKTWTLLDNPQNTLSKSFSIFAYWDTVGWILYREGKLAEAESFIQAAWVNRQDAEVGDHLAKIAEAKGNSEEALRLLELALATYPKYQRPGVRKTPSAKQKELLEHIETLRKAGVKEPAGDADGALLQLRTVSLSDSGGVTGSAEYRLLLSNGEVLDIQKMSDTEVPGARERIKGAKLPALWPKGSEAQLVRNAMLNCHTGICELVFEP
jgi:tetratricopeptide (TPR) repeat protein